MLCIERESVSKGMLTLYDTMRDQLLDLGILDIIEEALKCLLSVIEDVGVSPAEPVVLGDVINAVLDSDPLGKSSAVRVMDCFQPEGIIGGLVVGCLSPSHLFINFFIGAHLSIPQ
jgi:hypothetical protein